MDYIAYDDLVDLLNIDQNQVLNYLTELALNIGNTFAIISTPGIGKGFDFEGSGQYIIENECFE